MNNILAYDEEFILYMYPSLLFFSSCKSGSSMFSSSKSGSGYKGISRVRTYEFTHPDVPTAFDGFRIAFISDLHYRSLFKRRDWLI